jgi:hypothetical protein
MSLADVRLLDCNAVWTCRLIPTYQSNILPKSLGLKMAAVCSSETFVSIYKSYGLTTRKTNIDIFTALRTSQLLSFISCVQKICIYFSSLFCGKYGNGCMCTLSVWPMQVDASRWSHPRPRNRTKYLKRELILSLNRSDVLICNNRRRQEQQ